MGRAGHSRAARAADALRAATRSRSPNCCSEQQSRFASAGLTLIAQLETTWLPHDKEHFGFRDGLSTTGIEGFHNNDVTEPIRLRPASSFSGISTRTGSTRSGHCVDPEPGSERSSASRAGGLHSGRSRDERQLPGLSSTQSGRNELLAGTCDEQTRQRDGDVERSGADTAGRKDGGTMAGRCAAREVAGEGRSGVQQRERFPVSRSKAMCRA